jgi:hypothetical protein
MTSFRNSAPARLHRHLVGCLVAALLLLLSPGAFASALVPMCGERAETVAAPPPGRGANDASLSTPCNLPPTFAVDPTAPPRAPEIASGLESTPRLPAVYFRLPRAPGSAQTIVEAGLRCERAGFPRTLERPPR